MQCKKCGTVLPDTDKFCNNCGEPVLEVNSQNIIMNNQQSNIQNMGNSFVQSNQPNNGMNNQTYQNNENNYQQVNQTSENKKNKSAMKIIIIILAVFAGIIVGIILLFSGVIAIVSSTSEKLVCKSDEGNITIMYNKNGLTGYKTSGMTYDYEEQKEYAQQVGIDAYLKEFDTWFSNNTTGSCTLVEKD